MAKKYYKKSVEIKQNIKPVWTQILFLDVEDSNFDSLLIYSEKALMYYPSEPLYYYFNGAVKLILKIIVLLDVLETGIEYVFDNDAFIMSFKHL